MSSAPLTPELSFTQGDPDPYMTPCPAWCEQAGTSHHFIESCDEDRYHGGPIVQVPIRAITASCYSPQDLNQPARYTLGHVEMYLVHHVLHRDPQINANLNGTTTGVELTLDEAERIGRLLLSMVEATR